MSEQNRGHRKSRSGVVVSDKMDKTLVVQIDRLVLHPIYRKYIRQRVKYKVHDERNQARVGDTVLIEECRPLSRHKRWRLKEITHRAAGVVK
ncbi:30S ribosomal protein S17 [Myxococcota bacterium]|nr:30S ribosomal protein S17 [Myxococcota bacterium]MBU1430964.1 30S ribosomal protein S17 [Myxococcota bacterium]MBU1897241.1 30S ribosomal protein S17 [Myxococcota bacterium]